MEDILRQISSNWKSYRLHCQSKSKTGYDIKIVKKDHIIYDLVIDKWADKIKNKVNDKKYIVESSVGEGNLSAVPWLAIMNKSITESPREGFYIVYLFSRSAEKLYLCLGLGAYQFELIYGRNNKSLEKIKLATDHFRQLFSEYNFESLNSEIELLEDQNSFEEPIKGSSRFLVSAFQSGTCFAKSYDINTITNEVLYEDLDSFLESYDSIVEDPRAENLDIISEAYVVKPVNVEVGYEVPLFTPREKNKTKRKISTVFKAKSKRRTQESKKVGLAGEKHVYSNEYQNLKSVGREDLAKKIKKHYEINEYPGWDITSYDKDGNEIFIEVKSTKGQSINSLDITENEWNAAVKEKDKFYIYLVNNALTEKIKIFEKIQNPKKLVDEKKINLSTSVFELKL